MLHTRSCVEGSYVLKHAQRYCSTTTKNFLSLNKNFKAYIDSLEKELDDISSKLHLCKKDTDRESFLNSVLRVNDNLQKKHSEFKDIKQLYDDEQDEEIRAMAEENMIDMKIDIQELEEQLITELVDRDAKDTSDIKLEIKAGAGDHARLFARELLDMYLKYCQYKGWTITDSNFVEYQNDHIEWASIDITGFNAYRNMRNEAGVHTSYRHLKKSFSKSSNFHKSYVAVNILPTFRKNSLQALEVEIKKEHFSIKDSMNSPKSLVRLTHLPTGITVTGSNEKKSRHSLEMKISQSKVGKKESEHNRVFISSDETIRMYNFCANHVSDNRVKESIKDISSFFKGGLPLDRLIEKLDKEQKHAKFEAIINNFDIKTQSKYDSKQYTRKTLKKVTNINFVNSNDMASPSPADCFKVVPKKRAGSTPSTIYLPPLTNNEENSLLLNCKDHLLKTESDLGKNFESKNDCRNANFSQHHLISIGKDPNLKHDLISEMSDKVKSTIIGEKLALDFSSEALDQLEQLTETILQHEQQIQKVTDSLLTASDGTHSQKLQVLASQLTQAQELLDKNKQRATDLQDEVLVIEQQVEDLNCLLEAMEGNKKQVNCHIRVNESVLRREVESLQRIKEIMDDEVKQTVIEHNQTQEKLARAKTKKSKIICELENYRKEDCETNLI